MNEITINVSELQETLIAHFNVEKIVVREAENGDIVLTPAKPTEERAREYKKAIEEMCGIWADRPDMSVDNFLERMREDRGIEDRIWEDRSEEGGVEVLDSTTRFTSGELATSLSS